MSFGRNGNLSEADHNRECRVVCLCVWCALQTLPRAVTHSPLTFPFARCQTSRSHRMFFEVGGRGRIKNSLVLKIQFYLMCVCVSLHLCVRAVASYASVGNSSEECSTCSLDLQRQIQRKSFKSLGILAVSSVVSVLMHFPSQATDFH